MTDSYVVKELKKIEKIYNKIEIPRNRKTTELQNIILEGFDDIEERIYQVIVDYDKMVHSLDIQALVDDE